MKKIIFIILCVFAFAQSNAQNKIKSYEYWFDNDFMSKVTTNITPVVSYNLNGNIPTTGLPGGLHVFNVRFQDDSAKYSQVSSSFFFKQYQGGGAVQNDIVAYEYWFDNDYASKVSSNITATPSFNLNSNISTATVVAGLHVMNIRFRDSGGKWSQVVSSFFYKGDQGGAAQNDIIQYEYWYDNDYLNKVSTNITPQQDYNFLNALATNLLPVGLHVINVRFKDVSGKWSQVLSQFFTKTQSSQANQKVITTYQYWFDNDFGNNVTQSINPVEDYHLVNAIATGNLPEGLHTFNVRFKDTNNLWSQVVSQFVYKTHPIPGVSNLIVEYRYWADNNIAGATYVQLPNPIEDFHLNTTINMLNVPKGARIFNIQFKDTANRWSVVQSDSFFRTPVPKASFYAMNTSFCDSGTVAFSNNSFDTDLYQWDFGDGFTSTDSTPVHTYTSPGNYVVSLIGTDTLMNLQDDTVQVGYINVNSLPTVTATATDDTLCLGQNTQLIATGNANTYTWSNGVINNQAFAPLATTMYTLTGSNGICSNTDSILITVHNLPNVTIANVNPNDTVCNGTLVTLAGGGAVNYTWSGPQVISNNIPFAATNSGVFTVTGTDANVCSQTASILMTVNPLPAVAVASILPNDSVCNGISVTMTGTGALNYSWNGPQAVINATPFTALTTGTYTLTGTDANGCSKTTSAVLTVHSLPNVTIGAVTPNDTVCNGTQLTLSGAGALSYVWSGPQVINNAVPFAALNSGTYTVTGSNAFSCTNTATQAITVNPLPNVTVAAVTPNDTVCEGSFITLAGGGATNYAWSGPQVITNNTPFAAINSGNYTVTGTDANLCSNTSSVSITVNLIPVFSLGADTSICEDKQLSLSQPFNGATVLWNDNSNADTLLVNQLGSYWCSVTQSGCSYTDTIQVSIDSLPNAKFGYTISNSDITLIDSSTFATSYKWYFGDGDSSNVANPLHTYITNGSYDITMIVTNACGSDTSIQQIKIITGLDEPQIQDLLIYPNPATSQLFIDLKAYAGHDVGLYLMDMKGELLRKENYANASKVIRLDIASLSMGTYLLRMVIGDKVYVHRISIVK
ncbi:MAG: PKD domain-containing protein [Bacteroidetes bacterium]|nr:PKD domain-containing protein [Bacteroidota bacterium]